MFLRAGDIVLLTDVYTGEQKIKDWWSADQYTVIQELGPNIPTYRIEDKNGVTRLVHCNHLFLLFPFEDGDTMVPLDAAAKL